MSSSILSPSRPLDLVLSRLDRVRRSGKGWLARCPAHDDHAPSLSIAEGPDGRVLLRCHAGCETEAVVWTLGLSMRDLFPPRERESGGNRTSLTVAELARAKQLPEKLLRSYAEDTPSGVRFVYRLSTGEPAPVQRVRTALEGPGRFKWRKGDKPLPFGLDRLPPPKGSLLLVEGETDALTAWAHGIAALGFPGADTVACLEATHLEGVERLYVLQEPDDGGRTFVNGVARRLKELGWQGEARVVALGGHKDLNALHVALNGDSEAFRGVLLDAVRAAQPLPAPEEDPPAAPGAELLLAPLSEVEAKPVEWLWRGWIPRGRLTLVAGNPGAGKSYFTQAVAAAVTQGAPLPGEDTRREPASVILISLEDDPADTLRPRLEEMGADLGRVLVLQAVLEREVGPDGALRTSDRSLVLPRDVGALQEAIRRTQAALVVIDPLVAVQDAAIDSHRQAAMRQLLGPLHLTAQETGAAIVAVAHLRKSSSETALYRVGGSIDLVAAARVVIIVAPDPDDQAPNPSDRRRIVCVAKSNVGARPDPVAFTLEGGRFGWDSNPVYQGLTPETLLETPPAGTEERGALEEAAGFLREVLAEGPRPVKEIYREAREAGIAEITLRRAKSKLGVRAVKAGGRGGWQWELPRETTTPSPGDQDDHSKMINDHLDDHLARSGSGSAFQPAGPPKMIIDDHLDHLDHLAPRGEEGTPGEEGVGSPEPPAVWDVSGNPLPRRGLPPGFGAACRPRPIPIEAAIEVKRIENEALSLGWTTEELWQASGWVSNLGLVALLRPGDTVEAVTAECIVVRRRDGSLMRFFGRPENRPSPERDATEQPSEDSTEEVELQFRQELDAARLDYDRHIVSCPECSPHKRCNVGAALRDKYYEAWDTYLWVLGMDGGDEWEDIPF